MKLGLNNLLSLTLLLAFLTVPALVFSPAAVLARECSVSKASCTADSDCLIPVGQTCNATSSDYCINPAFITAGVKPNLLLLIDNSASMYDLVYQDTANKYCANATTTACTTDTQCATAGQAYCTGSVAVTPATVTKASCNTNADCQKILAGDTCVLTGPPAGRHLCTAATVGVAASSLPIACSTNSQCTAGGGTCPAGATCTWAAGDTCNNKCSATRQCYDTTYTTATTYSGYFDTAATYSYDFTNNKFTSGATMPVSCTYANTGSGAASTASTYVCVNTSGTPEKVVTTGSTGFVAKGNFLNWLTTSKFDVEKKILTGGKFDPTAGVLIAESRGCGGREFVKALPVSGINLTFSIRGGTPGGVGTTQSLATEYGQTYIEIYTGSYNAEDCLAAMNDWINVVSGTPPNLGSFQNDTKGCVGAGSTTLNPTNMWNHSLHNCFQGLTGGAGGYSTNINAMENECASVYASIAPADITDPNSGFAVCSSRLTYDVSGTTYSGYLGACWNGTNFNGPCKNADGTAQTGMTDLKQMENYCKINVTTNPIMDPSSTAAASATTSASIPGFVLQQGLANLVPVGTLRVQISSAAPTGLVNSDKYKDLIRFGAMTFQNNGSGSECGSGAGMLPCVKTCEITTTRICYTATDCPEKSAGVREACNALAKSDGSKIITYVGAGKCSQTTTKACDVDADCSGETPAGQSCKANVGDHGTGLIKAIDDIPATSWTPFAEAFYNAIGYFARTNDYSASTPTSRSDAYFNKLVPPDTATSYDSNKNPSQFRCQANNLLLITDGMSTADQNTNSDTLAALYASSVPNIVSGTTTYSLSGYDATNQCPTYKGSRSVSALAWIAKNRNIKNFTTTSPASTTAPQESSEAITSYVVYNGPETSGAPGLCDPKTLMTNTALNGGTSLFAATNPQELYDKIDSAFSSVAAKAASGTAASILSNSEGSGANILQAVFYPKKIFDSGTYANWIGEMLNMWYFVDPYINNSTIREDTPVAPATTGDNKLNLLSDYVAKFAFDTSSDRTMVQRYQDTDGDGMGDVAVGGLIDPDDVKALWRAGKLLWQRDLSASPRTIYTPLITGGVEVGSTGLMTFNYSDSGTVTALQPFLQYPTSVVGNDAKAIKLMKWVHGFDFPGDSTIRSRTVKKDNIPAATYRRPDEYVTTTTDPYFTNPRDKGIGVWKLGDIISSTPRVQSTIRLNTYDLPRPGGYVDKSYDSYVNSKDYAKRGMVYVGSNDGMLHAFNLGILSVKASGFEKASLTDPDAVGFGKEMWTFIPKNYLPFLNYLTEPDPKHLYAVDGRTVIFDASIGDINSGDCVKATYWLCDKPTSGSAAVVVDGANNLDPAKNTWRSIVIGGMGLGGASRSTCSGDTQCVQTPLATTGYSSYFALDVTDPIHPKFLWEFSNNALGYSTTGPAVVRVGPSDKNGRWLAIFGNGPFGKIESNQFRGNSDHHLRFFIVDLRTGDLVKTITTTIDNGFAGSMLGASIDADRWDSEAGGAYQDDAVYVGYTKPKTTAGVTTWTDGGVGRIMVAQVAAGTQPDNTWATNAFTWSTIVDGIGPVTTSIARLQDRKNKNLWLFFGTGRYYFRDSVGLDDRDTRRALFGIKEPCYLASNHLDKACTSAISGTLVNQTSSVSVIASGDPGWKIDLDNSTTAGVDGATVSEGAERVVTDTAALTNGTVFYTSFKPTMDICGFGGNSFLWGVKYDTGGQAASNTLKGKALIQLSTGEFKEVDLAAAFTDKLNRRMATPMTGKPPSDAPPIISSSQNKPLKRILHIQER